MGLFKLILDYWDEFLNYFAPFQCPICDTLLNKNNICFDCRAKLSEIKKYCFKCGRPIAICDSECSVEPCDIVRAIALYNDVMAKLIWKLKFGDMPHIASILGDLIYQNYKHEIMQCDVIIPVPMHWRRFAKRKYNQAALIAKRLSSLSGIITIPNLIDRTTYTIPQGLAADRKKNVTQEQFRVSDRLLVRDKTVALIDDVYTTGTTAKACGQMLKIAGATNIFVFVAAISQIKDN